MDPSKLKASKVISARVHVHTCSQIPANVVRLDNIWELISMEGKSSIVTDSSSNPRIFGASRATSFRVCVWHTRSRSCMCTASPRFTCDTERRRRRSKIRACYYRFDNPQELGEFATQRDCFIAGLTTKWSICGVTEGYLRGSADNAAVT